MGTKYEHLKIKHTASLIEVLKRMDELMKKSLLVFKDKKFIGVVSVGDIQRAIIKDIPITAEIEKIIRKNFTYASVSDTFDEIKDLMIRYRTECMPVLDSEKNLVDIFFWEEIFPEQTKRIQRKLNIPVVIMAGGKGTRLKPITNVLPKPLIPLGEKTILEVIMDSFLEAGCNDFLISVNFKAEMIEHYFQGNDKYKMTYFREDHPLGTAGALSLLKEHLHTTFFMSNCDIVINQDLVELYDYHFENKNELTIVAVLKHYKIPYGTLETGSSGKLLKFIEKPEYTFKINSGFYLLEPHLLNEIPINKYFHITELIENLMLRKGRIGVFPVSENSWKDIGNWESYLPIRFNQQ